MRNHTEPSSQNSTSIPRYECFLPNVFCITPKRSSSFLIIAITVSLLTDDILRSSTYQHIVICLPQGKVLFATHESYGFNLNPSAMRNSESIFHHSIALRMQPYRARFRRT